MKHIITITALLALLPLGAAAQTEVDLDPEMGGRLAIGIDKKITRGLHLSLEEEVRFDNNFGSFDRFHTTLAASYKVLPYLKVGLGYSLINGYSTSDSAFKAPRHRFFADVTAGYTLGDWHFSLRERMQGTLRTGSFNEYQNPQMAWGLKSRIKVSYKGFRRWQPYASFELRNTFSAPVITAYYSETLVNSTSTADNGTHYVTASGSDKGDPGWFLDGFNGVEVDRLRLCLGTTFRLDRRSELEFYLMGDYNREKVVDANAKGTRLKDYTLERGFVFWLGANYTYML